MDPVYEDVCSVVTWLSRLYPFIPSLSHDAHLAFESKSAPRIVFQYHAFSYQHFIQANIAADDKV